MVRLRTSAEWAVGVVAAGLCAAALVEVTGSARANGWGSSSWPHVLLAIAATLPVGAALRYPAPSALALLAAAGGTIAVARPGQAPFEPFVAVIVAVFVVGVRSSTRVAVAVLAVAAAGCGAVLALGVNGGANDTVPALVWLVAAWTVGRLVHARTARAIHAERSSEVLAADRAEHVRAVVQSERARIARELHDVVAHSVSVIVVHAQAGLRADRVASAHDALATIDAVGRQTVDELRRMLGILRSPQSDDIGPPAGLEQVGTLIDAARSTGLRVDVDVTGVDNGVPPGVSLAAYRIVQESLTNVIKHANATRARVDVTCDHSCVRIDVVDDGSAAPGTTTVAGHGLIGMAERAALYGGDLRAEPVATGGFRVAASLPYSRTRP